MSDERIFLEGPDAFGPRFEIDRFAFEVACDDGAGFCSVCRAITAWQLDPETEGAECEFCGNRSVDSLEDADRVVVTE